MLNFKLLIFVIIELGLSIVQFGSANRIFFPGEDRLTLGSPCNGSTIEGTCSFVGDCPQIQTENVEVVLCSPVGAQISVCCPELSVRIVPTLKEEISAPILYWDPLQPYCGSVFDLGTVRGFDDSGTLDIYHYNDTADRLRSEGYKVNVISTHGDAIFNMTYSNATFSKTVGFTSWVRQEFAVGGKPAPSIMALFMALVGERNGDSINWVCDGAVLNREWIITAAHCFTEQGIQPNVVRLGDYDWKIPDEKPEGRTFIPYDAGIANVIIYPEFNVNERYHDIALVKLTKPYPMFKTNINPICLPWDDETNLDIVGFNVTLTGWGATEFAGAGSKKTNILQAVELNVFDTSVCQKSYSKLLDFRFKWPQGMTPDRTLCVGWEAGGRDACKGDSGGPLFYQVSEYGQFTLAGIVSTGFGCGLAEYPGIYIPVNNPDYLKWIKLVAFDGFIDSKDHSDFINNRHCWKTPFEKYDDCF